MTTTAIRVRAPTGIVSRGWSEASLRISESLDLTTVLQEVLDSARELTGASYSLITIIDDSGKLEHFSVSGVSVDEARQLWEVPDASRFFGYLSSLAKPLRVGHFEDHVRSLGLPEFCPPVPVSCFLAAPIRYGGSAVGNIYVAMDELGREFSREDEGHVGYVRVPGGVGYR